MKYSFLPAVAILALAGCAGDPGFLAVNPHPIQKAGHGGRVTVVDGVEFWQAGTPERKYAVLGYEDEYWHGPAFDQHDLNKLAPLVKKAGGDAGIEIRGDGPAPGLHRKQGEIGSDVLRCQVIKYL